MRIVRLTCLFAVLLALAGCASTNSPSTSAGGAGSSAGPSSAGFSSGVPSALPSGSTSGVGQQPGPAPSDSDGLQVSGPVAVSLLSRTGPLEPVGPFLGTTMAELLDRYRATLGGQQPSCLPSGCWTDAHVPSGNLLLAVRPEPVACYQLTHITTTQPAGGLQLDLQLNYVCRAGAGTGARMAGWLFALPTGALPAGGHLTVRVSPRPGVGYTTLGNVTR